MSADNDLLEILKDAVGSRAVINGRRMFGGLGVYGDGIFFAIVTGGQIYFRTSDQTRDRYEAEGASAFTYTTKKGPAALRSYWSLPERLLDEPDDLCDWAMASIAAARDVGKAKSEPKTKPRRPLSRHS